MRRLKLTIEYDGTRYAGWQRQKNAQTVQETIEKTIEKRFGEKRVVIGAGRTDAGVHALGQVAHVDIVHKIATSGFAKAMNTTLPEDIVIKDVEEVDKNFHARYDAVLRWYRYIILNSDTPTALDVNRMLWIPKRLNITAIRTAAKILEGEHDFTSFASAKTRIHRPVRNIDRIDIKRSKEKIIIDVFSRAFLRNMIRIIVGTFIEIGSGKISPNDILEILNKRNRKSAGPTVKPHGLYLMKIWYD